MSDHDSGCKNKWPLLPGVVGDAVFAGERREHRLLLTRRWDDLSLVPGLLPAERYATFSGDRPFALWCGLNPSGAEAEVDDLTVRKEQTWTRMLGHSQYAKVNIGTYRWTDSLSLSAASVPVIHARNQSLIRDLAAKASVIILVTGKPPDILMQPFDELRRSLKEDGRKVQCLGTTKDGWPKHSSRIGYATPFVDFPL